MNPCRQELLRELTKSGKPVTPKYLSDRLGISASSVSFHLKKLESIGVVELDHTEQIRGITARFYRNSDVTVSIGANLDEHREEREILLENVVRNVFEGTNTAIRRIEGTNPESAARYGDILTGVAFLSEEETQELFELIRHFVDSHSRKQPGTHAWEYALLGYRMEDSGDE